MGFAGLSFWHIVTLLIVVVLVFGTKKLGTIGTDLGEAIKGFRRAMASDEEPRAQDSETRTHSATAADTSATGSSSDPRT